MRRRPNTKIYYIPNTNDSKEDIDYEITNTNQKIIVKEINKNELIKSSDELKKLREKLNAKLLNPHFQSGHIHESGNPIKDHLDTDISELWKQAGKVDINLEEQDLFDELAKM